LLAGDATALQAESEYVLRQGGQCVPVQPIRGDVPADEFYEYQLPEQYVSEDNGAVVGDDALYASAGTIDLQRPQTSVAFLYRGPEGLSLVLVHGSVENDDAGSVTFEFAGLPTEGEWIVKDDRYRDPDTGELADTNYDRWDVADADHRVDWTWGSSGTDGGVFRALGDDFEVTVTPAFNEAAALHDEYYEGTITDWEFLSATSGDPERLSLDLDAPIRIATGSCANHAPPSGTDGQTERPEREPETEIEEPTDRETDAETDRVDQEQTIDVEQDQEISADSDVETRQEQEVTTEQARETETGDREDGDDSSKADGKRRGKGAERGNGHGNGHEKQRGKGHERGRGKGHEKHGDEREDDD
jgi:hypothetical protein